MKRPQFILWRLQDRAYLPLVVLLTIILSATVALFFVVFSSGRVDGDSMYPTLLDGDRVLITKSYSSPRRGDVISFRATDGERTSHIIKRVIAVEGDSVEMIGDIAYVNGEQSVVAPLAIVSDDSTPRGETIVPPGSVFILGDNRPVSLDSRYFGPIAVTTVRGRVVAVFSPVTRMRRID